MNLVPCTCGAQVPNDGGVDHPVFGSAPPCWTRFDALLARAQRECPERVAAMRDAYALQHAAASSVWGRTIFDVPLRGPPDAFASAIDAWLAAR